MDDAIIGGGGRGRGMFGMDDPFDHGGQVFGGVGQRLVPEGHPDNNDRHHQRSVRDLACKYIITIEAIIKQA